MLRHVFLFCLVLVLLLPSGPAWAELDLELGAQIFANNCAACHIGGGNVLLSNKTLKQSALDEYGVNTHEQVTYQVRNGKNAMPAFKDRLDEDQIESVAAYVLSQAAKGWQVGA
ncbi:cytochrome c6 PetJ [Leptolyngbya sp. FACHB-261]|uniref:cytochrome c6 PetJ n=1 Tax=Leptolyngbya sp. FACHB-261 TaxID=2692806 RepID=UPI001686B4CD|nr:c-type cytochrome [Leptolyngbya sp. FACHB-261]MBD2101570.1 c-type cytochrome [Leptolyngbya sp. FACHB-261]